MSRVLTWHSTLGWSVALDGSQGVKVLRGVTGLDAPPVGLATVGRASGGAVKMGRRHEERPFLLPLMFTEADYDDEMISAFEAGGQLEVAVDGRVRHLKSVEYHSGLEGEWSAQRGGIGASGGALGIRKFPASFVALDPYWYDDAETVAFGSPEADHLFSTGDVAFNADVAFSGAAAGISGSAAFNGAIGFNSATTAFSGGAVVSFDLTSLLGTWPTFTISGPATYLKIVHTRTGEVIETLATTTIPENRDLVIVTRPEDRSIRLGGVDAWDMVTAETTATMQLLPGQLEQLLDASGVPVLDPQGRNVMVQGDTDTLAIILQGTTGASYVQVSVEERWLTP